MDFRFLFSDPKNIKWTSDSYSATQKTYKKHGLTSGPGSQFFFVWLCNYLV